MEWVVRFRLPGMSWRYATGEGERGAARAESAKRFDEAGARAGATAARAALLDHEVEAVALTWAVRHRERGAQRWTFAGALGCVSRAVEARQHASREAAQAACDAFAARTPGWDFGVVAVG